MTSAVALAVVPIGGTALAADDGVPPAVAADRLAERRMTEVGRLRGILLR